MAAARDQIAIGRKRAERHETLAGIGFILPSLIGFMIFIFLPVYTLFLPQIYAFGKISLFSYSITHNRRAGKVCTDEKREKIL